MRSRKYYAWQNRYGKANEHNGLVPRDFWPEAWEKEVVIAFHGSHPLEGYRRLTFMMFDADVVAVSPSSTYRVLRQAGLLQRWNRKKSAKGTGFQQPLTAHAHWHIDVSHVNIRGTFFYLCTALGGFSRYIMHRELWESMTETDVEIALQGALERFPVERPRGHLGQRVPVCGQGVHQGDRHEPRADLSVLPAEQRHDRAVARHLEAGGTRPGFCCRWKTAVGRDDQFRRPLQHVPAEQCHWLCGACGQAAWAR